MPARKKSKAKRAGTKPKTKLGRTKAHAVPVGDFAEVFSALKKVMSAHAGELKITADEPRKYYVVTKSLSWKGGPMFFGAVIWGKAYVSYHLVPLYVCPELPKKISPGLKRRMQGKACFNFRQRDEALLSELNDLTKAGLEAFRAKKLL